MTTTMDELVGLDLDYDLLCHLPSRESVNVLIAEHVSDSLIEDEYTQSVFNWQINHVREHGKPATLAVLQDQFDEAEFDPAEAVIEDLIARLRERYVRNNGRALLKELAATYQEEPGILGHELVTKGHALVELTARRGETIGTGDLRRAMEAYDSRVLLGRGASLGYELVDDYFYGQRGLTFTLAVPGGMKSWGAVNETFKNILEGRCVWYYSLELPTVETYMRLLCLAADVPFWRFTRGAFSQQDREQLHVAADVLNSHGVVEIAKPPMGQRDIESMVGRAQDHGADLIIIDQLQYCENSKGLSLGQGDHKDYWNVLNRARDLSDSVPIHFLHQFNRTAMFADEMPTMQQAKGAAAVEETATLVLGHWASRPMFKSNIFELGTLKARNNDTPSWKISYQLGNGCEFEMIGVKEEEEDEDE